jgi:hypothetical protein
MLNFTGNLKVVITGAVPQKFTPSQPPSSQRMLETKSRRYAILAKSH